MVSQGHSSFFRKRHGIARGRTLATQKRGPVIVEIAEGGGNIDGAGFHLSDLGRLKQLPQGLRLTEWEALPFIERACCWVKRHGSIPEGAHQLHSACVIPHVGCNGSA